MNRAHAQTITKSKVMSSISNLCIEYYSIIIVPVVRVNLRANKI